LRFEELEEIVNICCHMKDAVTSEVSRHSSRDFPCSSGQRRCALYQKECLCKHLQILRSSFDPLDRVGLRVWRYSGSLSVREKTGADVPPLGGLFLLLSVFVAIMRVVYVPFRSGMISWRREIWMTKLPRLRVRALHLLVFLSCALQLPSTTRSHSRYVATFFSSSPFP
jgi:hypothetical protein